MTGVWVRYVAGTLVVLSILIGVTHSLNPVPWRDELEVLE